MIFEFPIPLREFRSHKVRSAWRIDSVRRVILDRLPDLKLGGMARPEI